MQKQKSEEEQGMVLLRYGKAVLVGGMAAFVTCLILLLLTAVGISRGVLGAESQEHAVVISCVAGSFLGGLIAVRQCPRRGLFVGLTVGIVLLLLQLTLGVLSYDSLSLEKNGPGILCAAIFGGAAAGLLGRGGKRGKHGKKR